MAQKLRVPLGFVIAAAVLYFAEPTEVSILVGLPVAILGGVFRALAAGVIRKDASARNFRRLCSDPEPAIFRKLVARHADSPS